MVFGNKSVIDTRILDHIVHNLIDEFSAVVRLDIRGKPKSQKIRKRDSASDDADLSCSALSSTKRVWTQTTTNNILFPVLETGKESAVSMAM